MTAEGPSALLVIDVQVGVIKWCTNVAAVTSNIASLITRARAASVPVIWVQHEDGGLVRDSPGWAISPDLPAPLDDEVRIYKKHRDSFSVPLLQETLAANGTKHLILTGAQSDFCVRSTAHSALAKGYSITLPPDAHTTEDAEYDDGTKVSAEQIVAHVNGYFGDFEYAPGVRCYAVASEKVQFGQ